MFDLEYIFFLSAKTTANKSNIKYAWLKFNTGKHRAILASPESAAKAVGKYKIE